MPAAKAQAALQLKELYGCARLVVLDDGKNVVSMFEIAEGGYAVENAVWP